MAPDTNRIVSPLRQEAFELSPESQRELSLSDEIAWSWSILFGQAGSLQVPLACSAAGALTIDDSTLHADLATTIAGKLTSTGDGYNLADYFDFYTSYPPLYYGGFSVAQGAYEVYTLLNDCYDPANHYLRTHETP